MPEYSIMSLFGVGECAIIEEMVQKTKILRIGHSRTACLLCRVKQGVVFAAKDKTEQSGREGWAGMENNLLFANNRKEFIQEFMAGMEQMGCDFQIDTANSGLEAVKYLREKRYKIVVTGMNLSTFGGAKLIAYLNEHFPQTICMVYTRRVEPAYLKLLVNELRVFRIFQKPTSSQQLYDAIQEGFLLYEKGEAVRQERCRIDQEFRQAAQKIAELEAVCQERPQEKEAFVHFMQGMLHAFQKDLKSKLSEEEKKRLLRYDGEILQWLLQRIPARAAGEQALAGIQQELKHAFCHPECQQDLEIQIENAPVQLPAEFFLRLHFALWLVIKRFSLLSGIYRAIVHISFQEGQPSQAQATLTIRCPEGLWGRMHNDNLEYAMTDVSYKILEHMVRKFSHTAEETTVVYCLEF